MLFTTPILDAKELSVINEIETLRRDLRFMLAEPRRWTKSLARMIVAKAVLGSSSIEGYHISQDDAVAALEKEEPLEAEHDNYIANRNYAEAMTYILGLADDPHFEFHEGFIRSLHYMVLSSEPERRPGKWRTGPIWVRRRGTGETVYEAPPADSIPALVRELMTQLQAESTGDIPVVVRAAMAHLNLVMIHPFSDGNGRMSRALQTLVLVREKIINPEFCSIEEQIGHVRDDYYTVLQNVGGKTWDPNRDARPFVRFCLRTHLQQARYLELIGRRIGKIYADLQREVERRGLQDRLVEALVDAGLGLRVRNVTYRKLAKLTEQQASKDLKVLTDKGLLVAHGQNRGRYYLPGKVVQDIRQDAETALPWTTVREEDPFANVAVTSDERKMT
ncbi:MAG: Fic family protein [Candidatus Rokubacteria bacterium]|nr:Fic family protein [Candidatus Rokubacteria bacterium]